MIVFCDDDTCELNDGSACRAFCLEIKVTTGIREDGSTGAINACSYYKRKRRNVRKQDGD